LWPRILGLLLCCWRSGPFSGQAFSFKRLKFDYQNVYHAVAKEFKLPLWSYRDTLDFIIKENKTHPAVSYLSFEHNLYGSNIHPPWYVHRFLADLIAANFLREMWKCHAGGGETPESRPTSEMISSRIPKGNWKEEDQCDPAVPLFMDMTAKNTMNHLPNGAEATVRSEPKDSWKLMEDRPGKFGWIVTRPQNRTQISSLISPFHPADRK